MVRRPPRHTRRGDLKKKGNGIWKPKKILLTPKRLGVQGFRSQRKEWHWVGKSRRTRPWGESRGGKGIAGRLRKGTWEGQCCQKGDARDPNRRQVGKKSREKEEIFTGSTESQGGWKLDVRGTTSQKHSKMRQDVRTQTYRLCHVRGGDPKLRNRKKEPRKNFKAESSS